MRDTGDGYVQGKYLVGDALSHLVGLAMDFGEELGKFARGQIAEHPTTSSPGSCLYRTECLIR